MRKTSSVNGLRIRAAAVRLHNVGYIVAADPQRESADLPHALVFRWGSGAWSAGDRNYDAHSLCVIQKPDVGYVDISGQGYYSVTLPSGMTSGDIFANSEPQPAKPRTASFRSVAAIGGQAYAVGLRGLVYRLDQISRWTRIDDGLPEAFDIQAIHGFGSQDIYAVGRRGMLWHFDGRSWEELRLSTDVILTSVKCAGDGQVYITSHGGTLIRGRGACWEVVDPTRTTDEFWDVEWFEGHAYVSTMTAVYCLRGEELEPVDFGDDRPRTCSQLNAADGVMWSIGASDILSFDGRAWSRVA